MKRLVVGILIGLVLGGGSAFAATMSYWEEFGKTYSCEGTALIAKCTDDVWKSGYNFLLSPGWVTLYEGKKPVYQCPRKYKSVRCTDLR